MIRWLKERDSDTTEIIHTLFDLTLGKNVATIRKVKRPQRMWQVQIRDNMPWHRRSLESAKKDCEFVYLNCKR